MLAVAAIVVATLVNPGVHHAPGATTRDTASGRPGGTSRQTTPAARRLTIALGGTLTDLGSVHSVTFSPDGKSLVTADSNGVLYLWDIATGAQTPLTYINSKGVDKAVISPDGKTVAAVASSSTSVYLWNAMTRRYAATLTDPGFDEVISLAFSPDGKLLAVGDVRGGADLWDVATRTRVAHLAAPGPNEQALAVAFSPDGKTLAVANTGSGGGTFLWNVDGRTVRTTLTDPAGDGVNSVAFSPDGKLLAAGDNNGTTYLWDVASRTVLAPLVGCRNRG